MHKLSKMRVRRSGTHPLKAKQDGRFFMEWVKNPLRTGAITSSSRGLGRAMAAYCDPAQSGPVIELGPGTGPVTRALMERGYAPERLVLVEANPDFLERLRLEFPRCTVLRGDAFAITTLAAEMKLDRLNAVVSSLPLLTFPVQRRQGLLRDAFTIMNPGAPFVQFTYGVASPIPVDHAWMRTEVSRRIWWNLPPARAWCYRATGAMAPAA